MTHSHRWNNVGVWETHQGAVGARQSYQLCSKVRISYLPKRKKPSNLEIRQRETRWTWSGLLSKKRRPRFNTRARSNQNSSQIIKNFLTGPLSGPTSNYRSGWRLKSGAYVVAVPKWAKTARSAHEHPPCGRDICMLLRRRHRAPLPLPEKKCVRDCCKRRITSEIHVCMQ